MVAARPCASPCVQERLSGVREELVPIDHGFCLPEALESPYLEWLYWPQACSLQHSLTAGWPWPSFLCHQGYLT